MMYDKWENKDFVTHKTQLFSLISSISPKIEYNGDGENIEFLNNFRGKLEEAQQEVEKQATSNNDSEEETENIPLDDENQNTTLSKRYTRFHYLILGGSLLILVTMCSCSLWKNKGRDTKQVGIQKMNISWENYTEFEMDDFLTDPTTSVFPVDENVEDDIPLHPNNALIVEDKPTMQLPPPPSPSSPLSPPSPPSLSASPTNPSVQLSKNKQEHKQEQGESKEVCLREERLKGVKNTSSTTTLGSQLVQGSALHSNEYDFISSLIHNTPTRLTIFLTLFFMFLIIKNHS